MIERQKEAPKGALAFCEKYVYSAATEAHVLKRCTKEMIESRTALQQDTISGGEDDSSKGRGG